MREYYKILGINKDASQQDIQRAYRKLARKYHPDINKDNGAEEQFKRINEAYEVLKDTEKRKLYDMYGKNWRQENTEKEAWHDSFKRRTGNREYARTYHFGQNGNFEEQYDFNDIFSNIFSSERESQNFHQGVSQSADVTISLLDTFHGATKTLTMQSQQINSYGQIQPKIRTYNVKIPRGVTNGSVIRLPAKNTQGAENVDLLLKVHIEEHPEFTVKGHDLHTIVSISPWEAALGAKVPVKTVDNSVNFTIPPRAQHGQRFRLRGKGIPKQHGKPGDIIVELQIIMPQNLSKEEKQLFQKLADVSSFNPRVAKPQEKNRIDGDRS